MSKKSLTLLMCLVLGACDNSGNPSLQLADKTDPIAEVPVEAPGVTSNFVSFESGAVRPLAMSTDGSSVYVSNTPNHSLDIFQYDASNTLRLKHSVPVGLEPVAVALRNDNEVWVVNHISDSISIVRTDSPVPFVATTLLVGDEPRDIVFAKGRAFITTAHRGQHRNHASLSNVPGAGDAELNSAGVKRADIWVFDGEETGPGLGGTPIKIISLFGDTPRALAVTPDESKVYAAVLHSGNQTTLVHESVMCQGFTDDNYGNKPCQVLDKITSPNGLANGMLPGGRTAPGINKAEIPQPWTSMIVKYQPDSGQWQDSEGRNFSNGVRFNLPDLDVFEIDAVSLDETAAFPHVGTTLFNMVVNPRSGDLYVSNTDANNSTRFEGPGEFAGSTVQGDIARARITAINPQTQTVKVRPLNRHIDYQQLKTNSNVKQHSVAIPTQLAISSNGEKLYVAAMGSDKVAVYDTQDLDNDALWDNQGAEFDSIKASEQHISVAGGPVGLTLNEPRKQLLVYTRFDNALVVIDSQSGVEQMRLPMENPEPAKFKAGRPVLYDANAFSSNGESTCASCHIFADSDQLSWNLGNPDADNSINPQPFPTAKFSSLGCDFVGPEDESCEFLKILNGDGKLRSIAAMKGPMFTQTLRGMSTHGHMHWRGDRANGYFANDTEQTLDERTSFKNFIVAFEGLLGMDIALPSSVSAQNKSAAVVQLEKNLDEFADFMLAVQLPPNPIRGLNNQLSDSAQIGKDFFSGQRRSDGLAQDFDKNGPEQDGVNCQGCHGLDPEKGFYGTRGEVAHGGEVQILKVPQLRSLYTRVGMFGLADRNGFLPSHTHQHQGDQVRGFGFLHDGATDLLFNFLKGGVFDNGEKPCPAGVTTQHGCEFNQGFVGIPNDTVRQGLVDFMMEFDTDLAPIVGQQMTLNKNSDQQKIERVALLEARAQSDFTSKILGGQVKECDLIVQGHVNGAPHSYFFVAANNHYISDTIQTQALTSSALKALLVQSTDVLTFTCVVPGMGKQMAIDKNLDGIYNSDEVTL